MNDDRSLAVCIPNDQEIAWSDFWWSFLYMMPQIPCRWMAFRGTKPYRHYSRNLLVKAALDWGASHIAFLDCDQTYPQDTLARLLAHDLDVVGCAVPVRGYPGTDQRWRPFQRLVWDLKFDELGLLAESKLTELTESLQKVSAIGSGCLMVKAHVFSKVDPPWFLPVFHPETGRPVLEDDMSFMMKLNHAGVKVYCDSSIEVNHIKAFRIDKTFADRFADVNYVE